MAEILTRVIIERLHEDALQIAEIPPITHLQRTAELEIEACQEMTAQRAEIAALRRWRCEQDCRYTLGNVADIGGQHCPLGEPCERCRADKLRAALAGRMSGEEFERLVKTVLLNRPGYDGQAPRTELAAECRRARQSEAALLALLRGKP